MKRETKSAAALFAAAVIAVGASLTSFAAPCWQQNEDGTWTYYEEAGLMTENSGQATSGPAAGESGEEDQSAGGTEEVQEEGEQSDGDMEVSENQQFSTKLWKYFGKPENGDGLYPQGWFQVVSDTEQYDWCYADNSRTLFRGQINTIKGESYAFAPDGRRLYGLKLLEFSSDDGKTIINVFDSEATDREEYVEQYNSFINSSRAVYVYYFGEKNDGAMRTGKNVISLDGSDHNFFFEKHGEKKGSGLSGLKEGRYYHGGFMLAADTDEKFRVILCFRNGTISSYVFEDLIIELFLGEKKINDETVEWYNASEQGSFKSLIEQIWGRGSVDNYYLINSTGRVLGEGECKDYEDIRVVVSGGEITRIYKTEEK